MLVSAVLLLPPTEIANAQSADVNAQVKAFLSVRPNVVGFGQLFLINMWCTPAPGAHRYYANYTLTITKPDGTSEVVVMDSYVADGTAWLEWIADQVGVWTFKFEFAGTYFDAGRWFEGELTDASTGGQVYTESVSISGATSKTVTITVQEDIVPSWPEAPLPTDYWTRPVGEENREWWPILGSFPWFGPGGGQKWDELYPNTNPTYNWAYGFTPWVQGPESAHIVWAREVKLGGLMGGDWGSASSVTPGFRGWDIKPDVVLNGRCYQNVTKPGPTGTGATVYWQCYDIRTGDILWETPLASGEPSPTLVEYGIGSIAVPGAQEKPQVPYLMSISDGYLRKYDSMYGHLVLNVSIAPMTGSGGTYYMNGYVLGVQDLGANAGSERYRLLNWTTMGTVTNFADRIVSNTTYARSALPTSNLIDWNIGMGATVTNLQAGGIYVGLRLQGIDLYTGVIRWEKEVDELWFNGNANLADHGKLAIMSAKGYYVAYDLLTGREEWKTRILDYPWDEPGWGSYSDVSAYGQLFWVAETGIYAIDWNNGNINWKFESIAPPFETPYTGSDGSTVYPYQAAALCVDEKLYAYSSKHTPETPFYRGSPLVCIDVFTGDLVWQFGMNGGGEFGRLATQLAFGDGYMTFGGRDGVMYTFGRGQSETTVSAPQTSVPLGQSVLLSGSVLDMSPAQIGAPCVSHDSMAALMEQIHMGVQIGGVYGNVSLVGVPVSLDAVAPNGENIHIGIITSDGYSGTFGCTWSPEMVGQYTVSATFMGDESYGSSFATTYVTVSEASTTQGADNADNTLLYAVIGVGIVIIAVVLIVGFLLFKKKS